jgi:hypothetical protein
MSRQTLPGHARATHLSLYTIAQKDPYQHIDFLGSGAYGYVDTVKRIDDHLPSLLERQYALYREGIVRLS